MKRPNPFASKKGAGKMGALKMAAKPGDDKKPPTPTQAEMARKKSVKAANRRPRNRGRS